MAGVTIREIGKSFGMISVLKGISLDIADGEFIVLVGPSGCGKSTLLRIIAGLEQQNSGSILIGGEAVDKLHPSKRDTAMVFQSYALYPHLTVETNIAEVARGVPVGLVVEVWRPRLIVQATGRHGTGPKSIAELDDGYKAVSARSVPPLRSLVGARTK